MALQLSLPLTGLPPEPRRLWLLATSEPHLDALRCRLAEGGPEALIDSATGESPVRAEDAILLRTGSGRYEAYAAAAGLAASAIARGVDFTTEALLARGPAPGYTAELLAATPGRPPSGAAPGGPRNPLELLFRSLGGASRSPPSERLELCARALRGLDDDRAWLKALLGAQAAQLAQAAPDLQAFEIAPAVARALRDRPGLRRLGPAARYWRAGPPQIPLFPGVSTRRTEGVAGLSAFRVWGAALPLSPAATDVALARFANGFETLSVDEARLGEALGPLPAREVTAVVRPGLEPAGARATLLVSVDWELRLRLGSVFPAARVGPTIQLWVEDLRGWAVTVAKRVDVGQELSVPSAALRRPDGIRGVVAFRTAAGQVARQRFAFAG